MIKTTHLRGLMLQTPQLPQVRPFYQDLWGLTPVAAHGQPAEYLAAEGEEPWVIGFAAGPEARLSRLRLGLATHAEVDEAATLLRRLGVSLLAEPGPLPGPGGYHGLVLVDPDGRAVELSCTEQRHTPAAQRAAALKPIRMSHVVLNSPQARATADFYVRVLGFSISDWYEHDAIIFLRCNQDHHCVGIGQGSNNHLNHAAFLLPDQQAVVQAGERVRAQGVPPLWGPGRHGPGGNVFSYHQDPCGFVVEYTAELIQIEAGQPWQAKEWQRNPQNANVWGTGGPTPEAIRLMSGEV